MKIELSDGLTAVGYGTSSSAEGLLMSLDENVDLSETNPDYDSDYTHTYRVTIKIERV